MASLKTFRLEYLCELIMIAIGFVKTLEIIYAV